MQRGQARRVVVTGVGVVAPCGTGVEAFWAGLLREPEQTPQRRVGDVDLSPWLTARDARRLDRFAQLAMSAAGEALGDAGLSAPAQAYDPVRCASVVGTGIGGAYAFEAATRALDAGGPRKVPLLTAPMVMANSAAAAMSMRWGLQGPAEAICTACAAGTHAIGAGARMVADGRADLALVGGAEACLTGVNLASFTNIGAMTRTGISRPFDVGRDGFAASEGAAILVLESAEGAERRGVTPHAEVLGAASTADAHHLTAPAPHGRGAAACMILALADAGIGPGDIGHINAHGTSTPLNDAAEGEAILAVFGSPAPPVTSIKGVTGHALGAAGALEAVAVVLSMRHRLIPPTAGLREQDPQIALDVVTSPRPWQPGPVLSNSFGFGGHNGCVVLGPAA